MRKIIFVAYDLNPRLGSECGTAYNWLQLISKHYYVEVFTDAKHKEAILTEKYNNVNFNFVHLTGILASLYKKLKLSNLCNFIFIKSIKPIVKEKIKTGQYDLIHCITPLGIHSYNDLYKLGIPIIIGPLSGGLKTPPGFEKSFKNNYLKTFFRNQYYKSLVKNARWKSYFYHADKIIIGTPHLNELIPKEFHKKTVIIFDSIVDTTKVKRIKIRKSNDIRICFIGRLEPQKGCGLLLEAFSSIAQKYGRAKLIILGRGSMEHELKRQITSLGLNSKVEFLERISRDDVLKLLSSSDIFCLPTLRESGGTAILEAMACQLPVITTKYGGPGYSVTKECGIAIKPVNYAYYVEGLKKALTFLINNKSERIHMGIAGRKRIIAEFSTKAIEKKIMKVYDEVLVKK